MIPEEAEARMKAQIHRSLSESDLDLSSLDSKTIDELVSLVADVALLETDTWLGESWQKQMDVQRSAAAIPNPEEGEEIGDEVTLWEGRPFLSLSEHYLITNERLRISRGVLGRSHENIDLVRVQDVDYRQSFGERVFQLGDIEVRSHDSSDPHITLRNVRDPEEVYQILRRAVRQARKDHNLSYREEM